MLSKCLGCMQGVVLLSETHPAAMDNPYTYPLKQATEWFGLLTVKDLRGWKRAGGVGFAQQVMLMNERARARGDALVLRDWSHIDFTGVPFAKPTGRSAVEAALGEVFEVRIADTVRHPVDHWLSLSRLPIIAKAGLTLSAHMAGVRAHAEGCARAGWLLRYEDFTRDPDSELGRLCERLGVAYDPTWRERWASYETVTGDKPGQGRGAGAGEIRPLARREHDPGLIGRCRANADYVRACELLGYEP